MGSPTFVGYSGTVNRNGINNEFNIDNNDPVTLTISPDTSAPDGGDLILSADDTNTLFTIIAEDGTEIVAGLDGALFEWGTTGIMEDGQSHQYIIITVDGVAYMFLEDVPDPTAVPVNPFASGNSNSLDPSGSGSNVDHPVCFVGGTRILTPTGEKRIEDLRLGDYVLTQGSGAQEIQWAGAREIRGIAAQKHAPIRISAGAFGKGLPTRDLLVSPQHRILVSDWRAELLFGFPEVLVAAKHLVNDSSIRVDASLKVFSYHHILFNKHETVFSEGLPTESFHPGDMAMAALCKDVRSELLELFPELADCPAGDGQLSHPSLKAYEARALAAI